MADQAIRSGSGRPLVAVHGTFAIAAAIAAASRSAVQVATHFEQAPVACLLSAFAAVVHVPATAAPAGRSGVAVAGATSLLAPTWFPDATVWSHFGSGYGFAPLALPVPGPRWLRHAADRTSGGVA